ncbi:putative NPH3 domain-containing protein [Helianthus annuus]|uniref:NPH3 domain-containing protein n=1 Tax=Helianthus annuus TaxID=4232 RepID=A0A251VT12_HELAN|nr:putative NPH3 domain-containing protein [Helianthus annuus]KAJ0613408.1 putative NPH3 domain-containing protein [Helianthus annuus]KAJ0625169.1 putative NPH3 domain-containing protein [Helianthus annuus]KAJ0628773.1 putative NPH3 domain-containing protein [Helianthus annuus]KAJ0785099.1 putative NPH3 domain-containing protein [Helianthus annuus]
MSVAASAGARRTLDGVYEAIDVYLNKHKHLTESEREEICAVLDCNKMSPEASGRSNVVCAAVASAGNRRERGGGGRVR